MKKKVIILIAIIALIILSFLLIKKVNQEEEITYYYNDIKATFYQMGEAWQNELMAVTIKNTKILDNSEEYLPDILQETHRVLEIEMEIKNLDETTIFTPQNPWQHYFRMTVIKTYLSTTEEFADYQPINYATKQPEGVKDSIKQNEEKLIKIYYAIENEYQKDDFAICIWPKLMEKEMPEWGNPVQDENWYCVELK